MFTACLLIGFIFPFPTVAPIVFLILFCHCFICTGHVTAWNNSAPSHLELMNLLPLYVGIPAIIAVLIVVSGYCFSLHTKQNTILSSHLTDIFKIIFKRSMLTNRMQCCQSIHWTVQNKLFPNKSAYCQQRFWHRQFKLQTCTAKATTVSLDTQQQQIVNQAILASVNEAKAATPLIPKKANNWDNLATITVRFFRWHRAKQMSGPLLHINVQSHLILKTQTVFSI